MSYLGKKKRIQPNPESSRKLAERIHAKKRINQRLGFEINNKELKALTSLIQRGKYMEAEKQTNKRTKIRMFYPDTAIEIIAIYDKKTKNVVTVWKFEPEMMEILND